MSRFIGQRATAVSLILPSSLPLTHSPATTTLAVTRHSTPLAPNNDAGQRKNNDHHKAEGSSYSTDEDQCARAWHQDNKRSHNDDDDNNDDNNNDHNADSR